MHAPKISIKENIFDLKKFNSQMKAFLKIIQKDKAGNIKEVGIHPFNSFVANFCRILSANFFGYDNNSTASESYMKIQSLLDTLGPTPSYLTNTTYQMIVNSSANTTYGLLCGNTATANSFNNSLILGTVSDTDYGLKDYYDYTIDSILSYGATNVAVNTNTLKVTRRIENILGTSVTINEIGLMAAFTDGATSRRILLSRDILSTDYSLAAGDLVDIELNISITSDSGYTIAFLKILESLFTDSSVTLRDTNATTASKNFSSTSRSLEIDSVAGDDNYGIVVGNDGEAFSYNSWNLQSKIPHSSSGLSYGATELISLSYSDNKIVFGVKRDFENLGTSPVSINELGVVVKLSSTTNYYLIQRLSTSQVIEPNKVYRAIVYLEFEV